MKLPQVIDTLLHKKTKPVSAFLSLLLDIDSVGGAVWIIGDKAPLILGNTWNLASDASWEAKLTTVDEVISSLEEHKLHEEDVVKSVVLGLPPLYLTEDGDIKKEIRGEIKILLSRFELEALGYVSVLQALAFSLKKEEGVPTNAIFIGVSGEGVSISVYKSGGLLMQRGIKRTDLLVGDIEKALNDISDVEVLPSRMLLWGGNMEKLEEVKEKLLQHPWTTRIKVLHFPKIEILSSAMVLSAISYAGANELTTVIVHEEAAVIVPEVVKSEEVEQKNDEEVANVVEVDPQTLGFGAEETQLIKEAKAEIVDAEEETEVDEEEEGVEEEKAVEVKRTQTRIGKPFKLPQINLYVNKMFLIWSGAVLLVLLMIAGVVYGSGKLFSEATVLLYVLPESVRAERTFVIDATKTEADLERGIIPGKKVTKSVSLEKTVPATGKKKVGDLAQGEVVLYNKTVSSKPLKKGTILEKGSLKFSLNEEVLVASASESVGSITFGKTTAKVTAQAIGAEGNLPAGSEFAVAGMSENVMVGRSDKVFIGGTSKEVQVVARADYESILKAVIDEAVARAKEELTQSVESSETLVSETLTTSVTEKKYAQELEEEAKEVSGKITVTISGVAYSRADLEKALVDIAEKSIPVGYQLNDAKKEITLGGVSVKKDGSISVAAKLTAQAMPALNEDKLKGELAGVTILKMQEVIREISGVAAVEVRFKNSWDKAKLPSTSDKIRIQVAMP